MDGWFLPREALADITVDTLETLIKEAKQSHMVDVKLRLGGKDVWRQADWIKYLKRIKE